MGRSITPDGERVKQLRFAAGMTQEDLAAKADVSVKTISKVENGRAVDASTLRILAAKLGVAPKELVKGNADVLIDRETFLDRLQQRISHWDETDLQAVARILSLAGLLSLLLALAPIYAVPCYLASIAFSALAILANRRKLALPLATISLSAIGLALWPNALGVFPPDSRKGWYRFAFGDRNRIPLFVDIEQADDWPPGAWPPQLDITINDTKPTPTHRDLNLTPIASYTLEEGTQFPPIYLPPGLYYVAYDGMNVHKADLRYWKSGYVTLQVYAIDHPAR